MSLPLIIEVAINGFTQKQANPYVPWSTKEIVASVSACLDAGATIIHQHSDEPCFEDLARHASRPYAEAYTRLYQRYPKALLYPTLPGGGSHTTIKQRYAHIEELVAAGLLKIVPFDPGTMNWGEVGRDGVPEASATIYQNTFADVRYVFDYCREHSLGCTMSIFEPGFLRLVLAYKAAGRLPQGSIVKLEFSAGNLIFGLPPTRLSLDAYLVMLEGTGIPWMVTLRGGDLMEGFGKLAIERGGHVRVGIEDYGGPRQPRNEELVAEIASLAKALGRRVADFSEAAEILGLLSC